MKQLTLEEEERAIMLVFEGEYLKNIAKILGFNTNHEFSKYMRKNVEFKQRMDEAIIDSCPFLEEQLLSIPYKYREEPKVAEQLCKSIIQLLKYRDSKRYGDKTQIDVSMTLDIAGALGRAEQRMIDVTAGNVIALPTPQTTNKND